MDFDGLLSVIDVLRNGQPRIFRLNAEALGYLEGARVSSITRQQLSHLPQEQDLDEATMYRLLEDFLEAFWDFYRELLAYRQQPTPQMQRRLEREFDTLFTTKTGYWALDERIALTRAKKRSLLMVLAHPEIPLHNNPVELAVRQRVRKRKISFGPRVADGARAWDTFM